MEIKEPRNQGIKALRLFSILDPWIPRSLSVLAPPPLNRRTNASDSLYKGHATGQTQQPRRATPAVLESTAEIHAAPAASNRPV